MSKKLICECGREYYARTNSTIQPKKCPRCTYFEATGKKKAKAAKQKGDKKERSKPIPWREKTTADMIQHVQYNIVNPYIRLRDNTLYNGKSISDNGQISDAGHYYSVGAKGGLRFCVQNIHGQSKSGNSHLFKGGDLINYQKGLIERYGPKYVEELDEMAMLSEGKKTLDRYNVILIAETYIYLTKNKIWVTRQKEFDKIKLDLHSGKIK